MKQLIIKWLERILGAEGGYSNRSPMVDPGGETKWGISKRSYPNVDIKNLSIEKASEIYERDFIGKLAGRGLSNGVLFQLFDFGVHSGIEKAVKSMQKELGVTADGVIGKNTLAALGGTSDSDMVMLVLSSRLEFLTRLDNWLQNSRGWAVRIAKNLRYGAEDTE